MDSLSLPCEIVSRAEANPVPTAEEPVLQPINFKTTTEAIEYTQEKLQAGWVLDTPEKDTSNSRLSHPLLIKEQLFHQEGKSLGSLLTSGIASLDAALPKVRLDR